MKLNQRGPMYFLAVATLLVAAYGNSAKAKSIDTTLKPVLIDTTVLARAGLQSSVVDAALGVAYFEMTQDQERRISKAAHELNRCAGFESLEGLKKNLPEFASLGQTRDSASAVRVRQAAGLKMIQDLKLLTQKAHKLGRSDVVTKSEVVEAALKQVSEQNLKDFVTWLSQYPTRYNQDDSPNTHVDALVAKLKSMTAGAAFPVTVDTIAHESTAQKTVRVHIEGATRPKEIVILGGHLDSINMSWFGSTLAPGADDDASGAADLYEALRVMLTQKQPKRSVEIMFYAGEESGLLGSQEIAKQYKSANKDVVAVLQLDMTLFPGDGEFVVGSMNDFTSPWLRDYFVQLNSIYLGGKVVDSQCGYGCSDHASWFRQGYPTLMPFEATMQGMNHNLHTEKDVIDANSNFKHSAMFSRIALVIAMDMGNSTLRPN